MNSRDRHIKEAMKQRRKRSNKLRSIFKKDFKRQYGKRLGLAPAKHNRIVPKNPRGLGD